MREGALYIDGRFIADGERADATSPSRGERIGSSVRGTREDAARAVRSARTAASSWSKTTAAERARALHRVADAIEKRRDELADIVAMEQGKPRACEALVEVDEAAECFRLWAEEGKRVEGSTHLSSDPHKRIFVVRRPRGVYAVITPWNWPLTMPAELIAPALAAGNTVAWVAAPTTSLCAVTLARCIDDAGLPKGVLNLVTGLGPVVGDALASDPDIDGVAFIGSTATGRTVAARAAGKPALLELGGNGPFIVCADADLDRAAEAAALGAFLNAGQSCSAAEKILVDARVHDAFVERLVAHAKARVLGDPFDSSTTLGPLHDERTAVKVSRHVDAALAAGARALCGGGRAKGRPTNLYFDATVLVEVTPGMEVFDEETFGPVAPVTGFKDDEELAALCASSRYGLVAAVWTKDLSRAFRLGDVVKAGVVNVNETTNYWELHVPYGGVGGSGHGRIGGRFSIEEMTEQRTLIVDVR